MSKTKSEPYDSIEKHANRDDIAEQSARQLSLTGVSFDILKSVAAHEDVFGKRKSAASYRKDLAELGYFYGPVHDDTLYQRVGDESMHVTYDL